MQVTPDMVASVVEQVRTRLRELEKNDGIPLAIEDRDYLVEDDWLYICVQPTQPGVRASDYARAMAKIERELHERDIENVLLVPTLEDY